jgi:hypothetical protein
MDGSPLGKDYSVTPPSFDEVPQEKWAKASRTRAS